MKIYIVNIDKSEKVDITISEMIVTYGDYSIDKIELFLSLI